YSHDTQGRVTSLSRLGRSLSLTYTGNSTQPAQLLGPSGEVLASYSYGSNDDVEIVTYPDGGGYRYVYTTNNRLIAVTDLAGRMIEAHAYDGQGRAFTSELGDGSQKITFSYAATSTTVTDLLGNATTYDFANVLGMSRVTKITGPCASCGGGGGNLQTWNYDDDGKNKTYHNGANKTRPHNYNAKPDPLNETQPP